VYVNEDKVDAGNPSVRIAGVSDSVKSLTMLVGRNLLSWSRLYINGQAGRW
jgi:hypothetical protein